MLCCVVQTHPNACARDYEPGAQGNDLPPVLRDLSRQGLEWYNPRYFQRSTGRRVQLFVNYLFVFLTDSWYALKGTRGVAALLMSAEDQPAIVSQKIIDALRLREDEKGMIRLNESRFKRGQRVQIRRGLFSHESGIYDGMSKNEQSFVLMQWFGSLRRMQFDEDNLMAA